MDEAARLLAPVSSPFSPDILFTGKTAILCNRWECCAPHTCTRTQRSPHLFRRCRPPCRKSEGWREGERGFARDSLHAPSAASAMWASTTRTRGALAIKGYDINPRSRKIDRGGKEGELGERAIGRAGSRVR